MLTSRSLHQLVKAFIHPLIRIVATLSFIARVSLAADTPAEPPANDLFANRIVLSGTNITVTASNVGATKEPSELAQGDSDGGASVWWTWTAPTSGTLVVDTAGSPFDTTLGIYSGNTITNLTQLDDDDDGGEDHTSRAMVLVEAGAVFQIAVDGYYGEQADITLNLNLVLTPVTRATPLDFNALVGQGASFEITALSSSPLHYQWQRGGTNFLESSSVSGVQSQKLTITNLSLADAGALEVIVSNQFGSVTNNATLSVFEPAPNDLFANRTVLSGTNINVAGHTVGAALESGEVTDPDLAAVGSVWWTWSVPVSGPIRVSGISFRDFVAVYTGDTLTNLVRARLGYGSVTFNATAGTVYQIQVMSEVNAGGPFTLKMSPILTPYPEYLRSPFPLPVGSSTEFKASFWSASPLQFQWQRDGTNMVEGGRVRGVASSTLAISNLTIDDSGLYSIVARNDAGSRTNSAHLTVGSLSAITNGVAVTNAGTAPTRFFVITVPPGQKKLSLAARGDDHAAVSLVATFGSHRTLLTPFYGSFTETGDASLTIANPAPGDWFVEQSLYSESEVTLLAEYSSAQPSLNAFQIHDKTVTANLSGLAGWRSAILESSTNLQTWLPIQTNRVTGNTMSFTNVLNSSVPHLFFRSTVRGDEEYHY